MYVIEGDDGPEWALYDLTVDDVTGLTRHFIDGVSARILQQGARVEDVENVIVYGGVQYYLADTTAYGGTVAKAIAV
jgi:hypothetical protein